MKDEADTEYVCTEHAFVLLPVMNGMSPCTEEVVFRLDTAAVMRYKRENMLHRDDSIGRRGPSPVSTVMY